MKCKKCGGNHGVSYHLKDNIKDKGYPTHEKEYPTAHEEADKAEKKRFPHGYESLKHRVKETHNGVLLGKNDRAGRITVSRAVPKKEREEVAYHEKKESENLKRLKNGKGKR